MIKNFFADFRDFIEMLFDERGFLERHRKTPRGLNAPRRDWSYRR